MTELIEVDILEGFDPSKFSIPTDSYAERSFTPDGKDQAQTYGVGKLLYDGKPPFFTVKGSTYGVQKADDFNKKAEETPAPVVPGRVMLDDPEDEKKEKEKKPTKKEKWQMAIKFTEKPGEADWSQNERKIHDFIQITLRKIIAYLLANDTTLLKLVDQKVVDESIGEQDNENEVDPTKYPTDAQKEARLKEICQSKLLSKITRKVYRKQDKSETKSDSTSMRSAKTKFDQTKYPTLYTPCQHYVDKDSGDTVFITKFYDADDNELTWKEAVELGKYKVTTAIRFDDLYFGTKISPQFKIAEAVFDEKIEGGGGHVGRLLRSNKPKAPRPQGLVETKTIVPVANQAPKGKQEESDPTKSPVQANPFPNQTQPAQIAPGIQPVQQNTQTGFDATQFGAVPPIVSNNTQ